MIHLLPKQSERPNKYHLIYDLHIDAIIHLGPFNNEEFLKAFEVGIKANPALGTKMLYYDKTHQTTIGLTNYSFTELEEQNGIAT
jgi:hypothetical protein